jgi:hypothetical protein
MSINPASNRGANKLFSHHSPLGNSLAGENDFADCADCLDCSGKQSVSIVPCVSAVTPLIALVNFNSTAQPFR